MKIKHGFNDEETSIKIFGREDGKAELWIEQASQDGSERRETLAYITPDELLELKLEIDEAIKTMFGVTN